MNRQSAPTLPWLSLDAPFPPVEMAWPHDSEAPGLLAAGADLSVERLQEAYRQGIFPWFSEGQPILWWSTDPRMVLETGAFKLHPSLRKRIKQFIRSQECEIRIDSCFERVIAACASSTRRGQRGTWIGPDMIDAYCALHARQLAHSVETWEQGELVGGLYCVALGRAVFGESMFAHATDASKIALAALVAFCRAQDIARIDCQQNTPHLASLGAREIARSAFCTHLARATQRPAPAWQFDPLYWQLVLAT